VDAAPEARAGFGQQTDPAAQSVDALREAGAPPGPMTHPCPTARGGKHERGPAHEGPRPATPRMLRSGAKAVLHRSSDR
jgi:hypothetical protein